MSHRNPAEVPEMLRESRLSADGPYKRQAGGVLSDWTSCEMCCKRILVTFYKVIARIVVVWLSYATGFLY